MPEETEDTLCCVQHSKLELCVGFIQMLEYCRKYGVDIDGNVLLSDLVGIYEQVLAEEDGLTQF